MRNDGAASGDGGTAGFPPSAGGKGAGDRQRSLSDVGWMCYSQFMELGRMPQEVDGMDVVSYIELLKWRSLDKAEEEKPAQKYIDDFIN